MATALIVVVWTSLTLYAVLGGADFGGGVLHLLAPTRGRQRAAIAGAMAPVWEANHVWLLFALTGLLSAFPRAFAALGALTFVPATLALVAIVLRGAAFAFAGQIDGEPRAAAALGRLFGGASVAAPLLFGVIAGGLARSGTGRGAGEWLGPFQLAVGALAVALCAALAASFLAVEASRAGDSDLAAIFGVRSSRMVTAAGALALASLALAQVEAPRLAHGLWHRGLPAVVAGLVALVIALTASTAGRHRLARAAVACAVAAVMWGWGLAQYPRIIGPATTVGRAAASGPELTALVVALSAGFVVLAPSVWLLYVLFRRSALEAST
jgi:cytochrome bd ubiquinol oxidase subunit II